MSQEKFKVCPACGRHNPPHLLECSQCETDLTGIKPVDETAEAKEADAVQTDAPVRICECGAQNPPQARKCSVCGEDISDILPTYAPRTAAVLTLTSVSDGFSAEITESNTVIGREALLKEYLADKLYVSRQHAELRITPDGVFIRNISQTNHTYLNGTLLADDLPAALHEGDEIGLGGTVLNGCRQEKAAYFICGVKT